MDTLQGLRALAQRRHVHFDIRPDTIYRDHRPVVVGFEVRVGGVHDKGAHAMRDAAEEVFVAIRVEYRGAMELPVDACEERCLRTIRQRLRELGIAEL